MALTKTQIEEFKIYKEFCAACVAMIERTDLLTENYSYLQRKILQSAYLEFYRQHGLETYNEALLQSQKDS